MVEIILEEHEGADVPGTEVLGIAYNPDLRTTGQGASGASAQSASSRDESGSTNGAKGEQVAGSGQNSSSAQSDSVRSESGVSSGTQDENAVS